MASGRRRIKAVFSNQRHNQKGQDQREKASFESELFCSSLQSLPRLLSFSVERNKDEEFGLRLAAEATC